MCSSDKIASSVWYVQEIMEVEKSCECDILSHLEAYDQNKRLP